MRASVIGMCFLCIAGCQASIQSPDGEGTLSMTDVLGAAVPPTEVVGTFTFEGQVAKFTSLQLEEGVYEITFELRGMTLYALIDQKNNVAALDGFASANGADTQILDEDREMLLSLYQAINDALPKDVPDIALLLRRATGLWAEHPTSLDSTGLIMGEQQRGHTMLCDYAWCGSYTGECTEWRWYAYATHDDLWYDNDDPEAQQIVQIGDHYSCDGDQFFYDPSSGQWVCGEPDHWKQPYVVGNCYGRVGPGCGGDTHYTRDAADHDGCVRNGHMIASVWCNDEFLRAADDELFAPNCY